MQIKKYIALQHDGRRTRNTLSPKTWKDTLWNVTKVVLKLQLHRATLLGFYQGAFSKVKEATACQLLVDACRCYLLFLLYADLIMAFILAFLNR
jgi:hypothetical protein